VKTSDAAAAAAQTVTAAEESLAEAPAAPEQPQRAEESFEATIVRLDGAAAELLFRKAGE
jgi:hypothetical protein